MAKCKKCKEPFVYKEIIKIDEKALIKAICKNNHKEQIEEKIKNQTIWMRKLAEKVFTCIKCGKRIKPGPRNEIEDKDNNYKIPVRCPSGCDDDTRLIDKDILSSMTLFQYELR